MNPTDTSNDLVSGIINRRSFLRRALATGAGAALIPALTIGARSVLGATTAPTAGLDDADELDYYVLNFALNLEYLEAEFYSLGTTGMTLAQRNATGLDGFGTQGTTVTKTTSTLVPFETPAIQQYANEIAADELAHVIAVRGAIQEIGVPAAIPNLDLFTSFNTLATAANIGATFDPFMSETNFLLGGFIFEDVGVTAYHGAAPLLTSKAILAAAAGILAVEGYHASLLRTKIFEAGSAAQTTAQQISDLRDSLDNPNKDKDQGVVDGHGNANIVPTNAAGIAYSRSARQVLNIVYGARGATSGLFFPSGMNLPAA